MSMLQDSKKTTTSTGDKVCKGVGVTRHIKHGYKIRFTDNAQKRCDHLRRVKIEHDGAQVIAHSDQFHVQLTHEVSELVAAVFFASKYEARKAHFEKENKINGYTELHYNATLDFIAKHPRSYIEQAENTIKELNLDVTENGIFEA